MPELAGAYDAIANDGVRMPLSLVESCTTADGQVIAPKLPDPTRVLKESTASQMRHDARERRDAGARMPTPSRFPATDSR